MPIRHRIRPRLLVTTALLLALGGHAHASVSTEQRADYQRILFEFGGPARMQVAQGAGSVTLTFSRPITGNPESLRSPYITGTSLSPDGKSITLRTNQQYRVRQFISGDTVGIDLLTSSVVERPPAPKPAPQPKPKPAPTPPPAPAAPPPPKPEPAVRPEPAPKEAPAAPVAAPAPAVTTTAPEPMRAAATEDILTTKPSMQPAPVPDASRLSPELAEKAATTAPAVEPLLTTKKPATKPLAPPIVVPEPPAASAPTEPAPEAAPAPVAAPIPAPTEEIEPEQAAAETALPAEDPSKPFLVSARTTKEGTTLNFPWGTRTAAALFERDRDLWIVFSQERDAGTALWSALLPKQIVRAEQYKLPGATVLHLTTDGTLHASASQPEGGYEWNVTLSTAKPAVTHDTAVSSELQNGNRQLLLKMFDTTPPIAFYDPDREDRVLVVPVYEAGRGVGEGKRFPDFEILPTAQGLAVTSLRDDLTLHRDRAGLHLSGEEPLSISEALPIYDENATPVPGATANANVLMPYAQWYVRAADFADERERRLQAVANATPAQTPESMLRMVELYLGQGLGTEAGGYLDLLKQEYPEFYQQRLLAVPAAASEVLQGRYADAQQEMAAPGLEASDEARMWREFVAVLTPARAGAVARLQAETEAETEARRAKAADAAIEAEGEIPEATPEAAPPPPPLVFDYLGNNSRFIRFYPPRVRQRMAVLAAEAYGRNNQQEEAVKTFDTLNRDGILGPVQGHAEYALATVAAKKNKPKEALKLLDRLGTTARDPFVQAQARYTATMLRYGKGLISGDEAADALESLRLFWRGDQLQRDILHDLARIYRDNKRYDDTLRTWKYLTESFPNDADTLVISGDMAQLFEELFLNGLADDMPPLKSLALFYEFRELTPIGEKGNLIIQQLADRLAAVDLLDRSTQLLENQVRFRLGGEDRARVGARLALLYLLNKQPKEAITVLETTNFGDADIELRRRRIQLTAQALSDTGKHEEALSMLFSDDSKEADLLRLDILWSMKDWPNVINQSEDILSDRANLTAELTARETEVLMKLALGYTFEGDETQLRYLRDYYTGLIADGPYKEIFNFITNDTAPLDTEDFDLVTKQISNTEGFLDLFRKQIAAGKLSDVAREGAPAPIEAAKEPVEAAPAPEPEQPTEAEGTAETPVEAEEGANAPSETSSAAADAPPAEDE